MMSQALSRAATAAGTLGARTGQNWPETAQDWPSRPSACAALIMGYGVQLARVQGQSMAPTLADEDRLIVDKLA